MEGEKISDVIGLCDICGKPGAMFTCHLCGKIVCANCYDSSKGICIQCKIGGLKI